MQLKIVFFHAVQLRGTMPKMHAKSAFKKTHTRLQLFKTRAKEAH